MTEERRAADRIRNKAWRDANPERCRQSQLRAYAKLKADPEKWKRCSAQRKEWAKKNSERITASVKRSVEKRKAYEAAYPEVAAARRAKHAAREAANRKANPERYRGYMLKFREKLITDPVRLAQYRYLGRRSYKTLPWWKRALNQHWPRPIAEAMRRLGWSVPFLAKKLDLPQKSASVQVYQWLNGFCTASEDRKFQLQKAFAEAGEFIDLDECWPKQEKASVSELEAAALMGVPEVSSENGEVKDAVDWALSTLSERDRWVLEMRFFRGLTLEEAGREMSRTRERVRQIEGHALRALRHPAKIRRLEEAFSLLTSA